MWQGQRLDLITVSTTVKPKIMSHVIYQYKMQIKHFSNVSKAFPERLIRKTIHSQSNSIFYKAIKVVTRWKTRIVIKISIKTLKTVCFKKEKKHKQN